jgi:hypothetical protein
MNRNDAIYFNRNCCVIFESQTYCGQLQESKSLPKFTGLNRHESIFSVAGVKHACCHAMTIGRRSTPRQIARA